MVDRLKETIVTAGYNVYPVEIERVIAAHPAVAMVGVGCISDDLKGKLAQPTSLSGMTITEREIVEHCRP